MAPKKKSVVQQAKELDVSKKKRTWLDSLTKEQLEELKEIREGKISGQIQASNPLLVAMLIKNGFPSIINEGKLGKFIRDGI